MPSLSMNTDFLDASPLPQVWPAAGCRDLYERFDLLTASEIVIEQYVRGARTGDFHRVSRGDLGQACLNVLLFCHDLPDPYGDLVSSLLSSADQVPLQDCLPGVLSLREFAAQSLLLREHDSKTATAH